MKEPEGIVILAIGGLEKLLLAIANGLDKKHISFTHATATTPEALANLIMMAANRPSLKLLE